MIKIGTLDAHPSSPTAAYGNLSKLAQREDLYTGEDFYFGFASSNRNFIDIIGGHQPLAIKHGPIFSIYRHDASEGYTCQTYYIDIKNKTLLPIIDMAAKSSAAGIFKRLLPWSFVADYFEVGNKSSIASHKPKDEEGIYSVLENMAKNSWPEDDKLEQLHEAVSAIVSREKNLQITLSDLIGLKRQMCVENMPPAADDFVASYNPFLDNAKVDLDFLVATNPARITVRQVNDNYPRIELIIPGGPNGKGFEAVFKTSNLGLYSELQAALAQPKLISSLLLKHFREKVQLYFTDHALQLPPEPEAASKRCE